MSILLHVTYPGPILHTREYSKIHFSPVSIQRTEAACLTALLRKSSEKGPIVQNQLFKPHWTSPAWRATRLASTAQRDDARNPGNFNNMKHPRTWAIVRMKNWKSTIPICNAFPQELNMPFAKHSFEQTQVQMYMSIYAAIAATACKGPARKHRSHSRRIASSWNYTESYV